MARRSKDSRILIRVGADAAKRLARNAAMEKAASDRATRRAEKKARAAQNSSMKEIGKRAAQIARRLARDRATQERRLAKRKEKEAQRNQNPDKPKRKKPYHPRNSSATENYTSYARRLERSKKLSTTRASPTTFVCNGYTIKVTVGDSPKALSCTCADFTQVEGGKNWKGSNAGPFNPCKHMMAVKEGKWKCANGICTENSAGSYNSQAECEAALIPAGFTGGQCLVNYLIIYNLDFPDGSRFQSNNPVVLNGAFLGVQFYPADPDYPNIGQYFVHQSGAVRTYITNNPDFKVVIVSVTRTDGLPDDCGNPPSTCPI